MRKALLPALISIATLLRLQGFYLQVVDETKIKIREQRLKIRVS
jgi:hypothetical protein